MVLAGGMRRRLLSFLSLPIYVVVFWFLRSLTQSNFNRLLWAISCANLFFLFISFYFTCKCFSCQCCCTFEFLQNSTTDICLMPIKSAVILSLARFPQEWTLCANFIKYLYLTLSWARDKKVQCNAMTMRSVCGQVGEWESASCALDAIFSQMTVYFNSFAYIFTAASFIY